MVDPTFMSTEWSEDQIANALAFFNPYATLSKFVDPTEVLVEQQVEGNKEIETNRLSIIGQRSINDSSIATSTGHASEHIS